MRSVIYAQDEKGKFYRTNVPIQSSPDQANFVIEHTRFGDWSGFRTMAECERQFAELEGYTAEDETRRFQVVER